MAEIIITGDNFESEVINSDKPVLVDFWATWCGPCAMLSPIVSEIADERTDIKVCKVNVDDNDDLAASYGIESIPTILAFKDGKVTGKSVGYVPKEKLIALFD